MEVSVSSISAAFQQQLQTEVALSVEKKKQDIAEVQGEQLVSLIESVPTVSPTQTTGLNVNVKA